MKKVSIALIAILIMGVFLLTGCNKPQAEEPDLTYDLKVFYANPEYIETGNEELPKLILSDAITMKAPDSGEKYGFLIDRAMRDVPEGIKGETVIDEKIVFNSVTFDENKGIVTVDLKGENLTGGSLTEGFLISQIVESLRGSFEEVKAVQFLVDGEKVESLMGHFDSKEPFEEGIYK